MDEPPKWLGEIGTLCGNSAIEHKRTMSNDTQKRKPPLRFGHRLASLAIAEDYFWPLRLRSVSSDAVHRTTDVLSVLLRDKVRVCFDGLFAVLSQHLQ
jgi:hypothetical protein